MTILEIFSKRLKEERERQGMSVRELADISGVSDQAIYRYELYADHFPTTFNALRLADALGVTVDWLFGGVDDDAE